MNPVVAQWLPVMVMMLSILFGLLYNNKRLDDFREMMRSDKDLLRAEIGRSEGNVLRVIADFRTEVKTEIADLRTEMAQLRTELKEEIAQVRTELKEEIAQVRTDLKGDIAGVDGRLSRLEVIRSR